MIQVITATFENGVLKPDEVLNLPAHARVRLAVEPLQEGAELLSRQQVWEAVERLWWQSPINSHGEHLSREQLQERS